MIFISDFSFKKISVALIACYLFASPAECQGYYTGNHNGVTAPPKRSDSIGYLNIPRSRRGLAFEDTNNVVTSEVLAAF